MKTKWFVANNKLFAADATKNSFNSAPPSALLEFHSCSLILP